MHNCRVCNEPYDSKVAADYCATFSTGRFIYKKDEQIRALSWTTAEETAGWRNAVIKDVYIERSTHHPMYLVQFHAKAKGEEWFARLEAIRIKPARQQGTLN